jgi:large subunit ribosomal protein L3|tara:strand:- start:984 stop:1601 length:618 start_codon:yes stop_codon:yes gene_type:complete
MSGIIGKKIGMTSIYDQNGKNIPCTIIEAGPCVVTQIKTNAIDGYSSIQLAYDEISEKNIPKSKLNHFKKANTSAKKKIYEFKNFEYDLKLGDQLCVDHFIEGEFVDVSGISKGKGFQGVVKRHGFAGVGQSTHGQHNRLRAPGSIGAASYPARVFKGMRMAGQTGNKKNTVQNLRVLKIVLDKNIIVLKGCVPGHKNSYLTISK